MEMTRTEKTITYLTLVFVLGPAILVLGLWYIVISDDLIKSFVESRLKQKSLTLIVDNLEKKGFLALRMKGVEIRKEKEAIISLDVFEGRLSLLQLFSFDLVFPFEASVHGGTMRGEIRADRSDLKLNAVFDQIPLNAVSLLSGITGNAGRISGSLSLNGMEGEGRFSLQGSGCISRLLARFPVPLPSDTFTVASARVSVAGGTVQIASANFEGLHAYARLKGEVREGMLDGVAEFKPKKSFLDRNPHLLYLLREFQVAPLDYRIPVKRINILPAR